MSDHYFASTERIREEAARWALRLSQDELSELEREQFERWLLADEVRAAEFRKHMAVAAMISELPLQMHAQRASEPSVSPAMAPRRGLRLPGWWAGVGALILGMLAWAAAAWVGGEKTYSTDARETPADGAQK